MSQSFWKSDVAEEPQTEQHAMGSPAEQAALAMSANDFSALEERILRAIELVKRERQARTAAEDRAAKAEAQIMEQAPVVDQLQQEVRSLRTERDQVRQQTLQRLKTV